MAVREWRRPLEEFGRREHLNYFPFASFVQLNAKSMNTFGRRADRVGKKLKLCARCRHFYYCNRSQQSFSNTFIEICKSLRERRLRPLGRQISRPDLQFMDSNGLSGFRAETCFAFSIVSL